MICTIKDSIYATKGFIDNHTVYPTRPGIYAIFLAEFSFLYEFGEGGQILYIGIAKKSLKDRDIWQHFKTGRAGKSSLRRSLGAILKEPLNLTAIPRGCHNDSKRYVNYAFEPEGDARLTDWMRSNLKIGYWEEDKLLDYSLLRELEKELTIKLLPTLDLDKRTIKLNRMAPRLIDLRNSCKQESINIKHNQY